LEPLVDFPANSAEFPAHEREVELSDLSGVSRSIAFFRIV